MESNNKLINIEIYNFNTSEYSISDELIENFIINNKEIGLTYGEIHRDAVSSILLDLGKTTHSIYNLKYENGILYGDITFISTTFKYIKEIKFI